ncbi:HNH endonuclease [Microbacterium sp. cx-55]|uniref:HNH endonuclease n=1 Tax=Microbacterium sp. cx-55 TaxID=2875948 RepID=UPI001CC143E1|nr:HNH endonuclease [Microbacterium sp. cx-55]MBZ4486272.1 HNH endonuclease [Microbacterium sp. cx-55]
MTELVLETYGRVCWLQLPGCTKLATTKDHVIPHDHGGPDTLENYRPACKHCNSKRQDRVLTGYGASVVVVIGPPAAGKTTWILERAKPGDVMIDMDRIARALMPVLPDATHEYPDHVRHVAISARKAAIRRATRLRERVTVWLIHALPPAEDLAEYRAFGWHIETIDPGRAVVEERTRTMRPAAQMQQVDRWYAEHPEHLAPSMVDYVPAGAQLAADASPDW